MIPAVPALGVAAVTLATLFLTAAAAGHDAPPAAETAQAPPEEMPGGAELYLRDCAWCHGEHLEGTARGPSLIGVGEASASFYLTTGRMPIDEADAVIRRRDPAYPPEQIRALVEHVAAVGGGPPGPAVDPGAGDLGAGGELFRLHCAACHGATGAGFPLLGGRNSPTVWEATAREVAEAVRIGPGGMPVFSTDTVSDEEVDSIVRYVLYLQDPEDRGGYHLFRVGPLTEGVIAWLAGVAILVVAARLLGEKQ